MILPSIFSYYDENLSSNILNMYLSILNCMYNTCYVCRMSFNIEGAINVLNYENHLKSLK